MINGIGGAGLPAELMQYIEKMSDDLGRVHRDRAMQDATNALKQGLKEAKEMRAAAGFSRLAGIVGGGMTALGGIAQARAGANLQTEPTLDSRYTTEQNFKLMEAHNADAVADGKKGETLIALGSHTADFVKASADDKNADAKEANARAEAFRRSADAEQTDADMIQRTLDRARDHYAEILNLQHSSVMAILRG